MRRPAFTRPGTPCRTDGSGRRKALTLTTLGALLAVALAACGGTPSVATQPASTPDRLSASLQSAQASPTPATPSPTPGPSPAATAGGSTAGQPSDRAQA